jgi:hypothetical protein
VLLDQKSSPGKGGEKDVAKGRAKSKSDTKVCAKSRSVESLMIDVGWQEPKPKKSRGKELVGGFLLFLSLLTYPVGLFVEPR